MKRTPIFILTITIALLTIGYSQACIREPPAELLGLKFKDISIQAAEEEIAIISAQITEDGKAINIQIINAYPEYQAQVTYTILNAGNKPAYFKSITIENPNQEALEITITEHTGSWLPPNEETSGSVTIKLLEGAEENTEYHAKITISITYQRAKPRSVGFWKKQFKENLDRKGKPQIDAETLENYLNQINASSQIFEFTGSRRQKFQQALNILDPQKPRQNMEEKLKAQLLALWLNHVAGWTEGYTVNGMTAQQIIEGSENALINKLTSQYEYWKNLCEEFNNIGG